MRPRVHTYIHPEVDRLGLGTSVTKRLTHYVVFGGAYKVWSTANLIAASDKRMMKTTVAWHTKIRGSMHLETGVPRSMGEGLAASRRCQVRALHFNTNWQSYHTALRSILKYSCNFGKMSCSPCVVVYVTWTLLTPAQVVPLAIYCLLVWGEGFSLLFPLVLY